MGEGITFSDAMTAASGIGVLGGFLLFLYGSIGNAKTKTSQKRFTVIGLSMVSLALVTMVVS